MGQRAQSNVDSVSIISGRSFITTNENNIDREKQNQSLIINFQVPLKKAEGNLQEDQVRPILVPEELTNRVEVEEGRVYKWYSPLKHRQ